MKRRDIEEFIELGPWSWSNIEEFHNLGNPPEDRVEALRVLCDDDDRWIAYRSAAMLAAMGDEDGIMWFVHLIDDHEGGQEPVQPHRLWSYENYDVIAKYALLFGEAGGSRDIEAAVYRRLLKICHRFEMAINFPTALELSAATPLVRSELLEAVERGVAAGGANLVEPLLPALVLVAPVQGAALVAHLLPTATKENAFPLGAAIAEIRTRAGTAWAHDLAKSESAVFQSIGDVAVDAIENRTADSCYEWWRGRWDTSWLDVARRLVEPRSRCQGLARIAAYLWGGRATGVDLDEVRRNVVTGYAPLHSEWSRSSVADLLRQIDRGSLSPSDSFEVVIIGTLLGWPNARRDLDAMLADALSCAMQILPNSEFDRDDAYGEIAGAAYVYAREADEWDAFQATAGTLLSNYEMLGDATKLGAALVDGQSVALLPRIERAFRDAFSRGAWYSASKLLPAMMRLRSEHRWLAVESVADCDAGILSPSTFAAISLAYDPCERARSLAERLVHHENQWTAIFAEEVLGQLGAS